MKITKRDGSVQPFQPNKILTRIKVQSKDLKGVNPDLVFQKVIPSIKDGMTSTEVDEITAYAAADLIIEHPDYSVLGGRVLITRQSKIIGFPVKDVDLKYDFFGAVTFLKKYSVLNDDERPLELPSTMIERVANFLGNDEQEINLFAEELMSRKSNCASPIYTNAGVPGRGSMISCNLTQNIGDDFDGIEDTLRNVAAASKAGSGIGISIDNVRSEKSLVSSFKGNASGLVRYADMVQGKMRFYKQGTRSGSAALYLHVFHKDILRFLDLTLPIGDEKLRARDLFTAVVIPDLFMKTLEENGDWYLFCPNDIVKAGLTPLQDLWGEEFEKEYWRAVDLRLGEKIPAKRIIDSIINSQVASGRPYVMFKDNANKRNMQDNIGVVSQSNLCIEVFQVSKPNYTPQCTLSSINLAEHNDVDTIDASTRVLVRLLNRVIDKNIWSDDASKNAGLDQRALAIGVAGLADFFAKKGISFESQEAKDWNDKIFSTMYKASVEESMKMAIEEGRNYPAYEGSRYSKGETYIPGWSPLLEGEPIPMLNSLVLGLMPTASSAILLGSFESFLPVDSNMFTRRVGQGEFLVVNKYLVNDLEKKGLWTKEVRDLIIKGEGSVQNIESIPDDIKSVYKTVWEIPQRLLIDLAVIRNKYVDQSQSMNLYFSDAKYGKILSALTYGWKNGLKTGVYYTRTRSKLETSSKLAGISTEEVIKEKPADSPFSCFGCSS